MKIVVTGGNGLLGSSIANYLADRYEVISIDKSIPSFFKNSKITYLAIDLSNSQSVSLITKIKPTIIIHCAALIPVATGHMTEQDAYIINCSIDKNIVNVAFETTSYLIYASGTNVYGFEENDYNVTEENLTVITDLYSRVKIESEILIKETLNNYLILRINAPYGRHTTNKTVLTIFSELAVQNKTLQYHGSGTRMQDFTHVNDISSLIYCQLKSESFINGVFNISYGKPISMLNLAELIVKTTESNSEIKASGQIDKQENYKASYSIDKAKTILGWSPKITLQTGIKELLNNMRKC